MTFAAALTFLALWFGKVAAVRPEPLFHGKPESEWIKQLKYHDDEQVKEWRGYGEEGVRVLVRGLERATRPGEPAYRHVNGRLPAFVKRWLPAPKPDSTQTTRQCLVSLLGSPGTDAKSAAPVMIRTACNDEASSVRQGAIGYFITSAGDDTLLNQLPSPDGVPSEHKQSHLRRSGMDPGTDPQTILPLCRDDHPRTQERG